MQLDAILFDLDGTLITTDDVSFEAFRDYLHTQHNHRLNHIHYGHTIGLSNMDVIHKLEEHTGLAINGEHMLQEVRKQATYEKAQLKPGARELLEYCRTLSPLALATTTSQERLERKTNHLNIQHYFDVIITGDMVERLKPDPELYLEAIKKLHIKASHCLVIEDNETGIQAGKAAGATVLFVPNPYIKDPQMISEKYDVQQFADLHEVKLWLEANH